jgi:predicted NBD/HSP70 family sugar kinase
MTTQTKYIRVQCDEGYHTDENLLKHINDALGQKDIVAEKVVAKIETQISMEVLDKTLEVIKRELDRVMNMNNDQLIAELGGREELIEKVLIDKVSRAII